MALIVDGPLTELTERTALVERSARLRAPDCGGKVGASVRFEGIVRRNEPDHDRAGEMRDLTALEYQTYDPMAERELAALANEIASRHQLLSLVALHSRGRVEVGEISFVLTAAGTHRAETLAAIDEFIVRLKRDIPIWKTLIWEPRLSLH